MIRYMSKYEIYDSDPASQAGGPGGPCGGVQGPRPFDPASGVLLPRSSQARGACRRDPGGPGGPGPHPLAPPGRLAPGRLDPEPERGTVRLLFRQPGDGLGAGPAPDRLLLVEGDFFGFDG